MEEELDEPMQVDCACCGERLIEGIDRWVLDYAGRAICLNCAEVNRMNEIW